MPIHRLTGTVCTVAGILALICACSGTSSPDGDPDPGHRSLATLEPVLSVIPEGAHVMYERRVDSHWDSCNGASSTYGWDPVTVNAEFTVGTAFPQVVSRARAAMGKLGWTYDTKNSSNYSWVWSRQVSGRTAATTLEIDKSVNPPKWSLDAVAPPAVHPVTGC